jgi:hypothetical protein
MSWLNEELSPFASEAPPQSPGPVPWEDPSLPRPVGFYRTLKGALRHPWEFFGRLPGPGWAEPLAFALIIGTLGLLASFYWQLLLMAIAQGVAGDGPGMMGKGLAVALMLLVPVLVLAHLIWGSLCLWGGVALLGVKTPFIPVWRIYCYAQASLAAALIPFLGGPIAGVWMLYLIFRGVERVFGMTVGRALGALIVSLVLQALILGVIVGSLAGLLGLMWFSSLFS